MLKQTGAVNPRDNDLKITDGGDHLVFDGYKNFNTGGVVSDLTVLEGVLAGTENHIFAFVLTEQPGIQFAVRNISYEKVAANFLSTTGTTSASVSLNPALSKSTKSRFLGQMLSAGILKLALPTQRSSQYPLQHFYSQRSNSSSPTSTSALRKGP
jgi:hypothetical protein